MNNTIKGLFALTLLASATVQAAYVVYVPTEIKNGGSLPDGSINFVTKTEEPTEPEVPQERFVEIDLIKKYKSFNSKTWPNTETRNTSSFNTIAGGFSYEMYSGKPAIIYTFKYGTDSTGKFHSGVEFETFTPPRILTVEYDAGTANCTGSGTGSYVPYSVNAGMEYGGTYRAVYTCDVQLAKVMNQPAFMNLKFKLD